MSLLALAAAFAAPAAALGQVDGFSLINKSGAALSGVPLRRIGSDEWLPLPVAPGAGANVRAPFASPDCAFDLRATVAGGDQVTWRGINLCDVKSVTLNRDRAGRSWVEYD
ncbi:MAG: hypothetical protein M3Q57_00245 [Pseudomonadota bacterium]|nr:hypothetical protein [Pseudomonadota bacterium]